MHTNQAGFIQGALLGALALFGVIVGVMSLSMAQDGVRVSDQRNKAYASLLDKFSIDAGSVALSIISGPNPLGMAVVSASGLFQGTVGSSFVGVAYSAPVAQAEILAGAATVRVALNTNISSPGTYVVLSPINSSICIAHALKTNYTINAIGSAVAVSGLPATAVAESSYSALWPDHGCVLNGSEYAYVTRVMS